MMSFSAVCASKTKGMTRSLLTLLLVLLPAELAGLKLGRQPWPRSLSQEAVSPISRRAVFQYAVLPHLVSWPLFLGAPRQGAQHRVGRPVAGPREGLAPVMDRHMVALVRCKSLFLGWRRFSHRQSWQLALIGLLDQSDKLHLHYLSCH